MKPLSTLLALLLLLLTSACALADRLPGSSAQPPASASGSVLFQDDFSNPLSGWDHVLSDGGSMDYDSGIYRFLVAAQNFNYWSTPKKRFTDTRVEVDTAKLGGPDSNRAGIVCRVNNDQFYFFVISSDGYYAVGRTNGLESYLLGQDQMMPSSNIHTGVAINHLRADCVGTTLTFYINGFPVSQVSDSTLASGDVGLIAGAFEEGGVDIIFDQFVVMQP